MTHRHQQDSHRPVAAEFSQSLALLDLEVRPNWWTRKRTYHDHQQSAKQGNIIHTVCTPSVAIYVLRLCCIFK